MKYEEPPTLNKIEGIKLREKAEGSQEFKISNSRIWIMSLMNAIILALIVIVAIRVSKRELYKEKMFRE